MDDGKIQIVNIKRFETFQCLVLKTKIGKISGSQGEKCYEMIISDSAPSR